LELKTNRHNRPIQKSELDIDRLYPPIQSEDRIGIGRSINRTFRPPLLKPHVSQSGPLFIGRLLYLSARPLIILYDARVSSSQSHLLLGFVTNLLLFTPLGGTLSRRRGVGWGRDRMQMARLGNFLFSFQLIFRTKPGGNEQKVNKACGKKAYR